VIDADNIQDALNVVKAYGGTVHLTDGKYYVSRNIVVERFWGKLMGDGMDKTIIEAVRQSESVGFAPAESQWWTTMPLLPTVLQFDYPVGDVAIRDLTVQVEHPNPADPYLHPWVSSTIPTTAISTLIEMLGGDHNTVFENVRFKGASGDALGTNLVVGTHVMLGEQGPIENYGIGDLRFQNVLAEDMFYGLVVMRYESSEIKIVNARATNTLQPLYVGPAFNSSVKISNADITLPPEGRYGIWLQNIPSGLEVTGNTITGSALWYAMRLNFVSNATIVENTIKDVELGMPWSASIFLNRSHDNQISANDFEAVSGGIAGIRLRPGSSGNTLDHNHFVKSDLPGWTASSPDGPGAILLDGSTNGNAVFEMMFPSGKGIARCQMIRDMTDDPETPEYDGVNEIHNWQPCENLADREARNSELVPELELNLLP
jgi:hypothetical protein